jgi:hypothetical protein
MPSSNCRAMYARRRRRYKASVVISCANQHRHELQSHRPHTAGPRSIGLNFVTKCAPVSKPARADRCSRYPYIEVTRWSACVHRLRPAIGLATQLATDRSSIKCHALTVVNSWPSAAEPNLQFQQQCTVPTASNRYPTASLSG